MSHFSSRLMKRNYPNWKSYSSFSIIPNFLLLLSCLVFNHLITPKYSSLISVFYFNRLGGGSRDALDVMEHVFFQGINWEDVYNRKVLVLCAGSSVLLSRAGNVHFV